jgi:LuxR family maltose regulon positive regulatory protein
LHAVEPLPPDVLEATVSGEGALPLLAGALLARAPCAIVLDDFGALSDARALRAVEVLVERLGPGSTVALASRREPRLPLGRLRAGDGLVELRRDELRMTPREGEQLLRRSGLRLSPEARAMLVTRTEGWPAGLRLATVALRDAPDRAAAAATLGGDERAQADYVEDQIGHLTPRQRDFLVRTSPLEDLSGELCDAVLRSRGSGRMLRELGRSDVLLEPLDRAERHFRHHPLLAEALRAELHRNDPRVGAAVHRRASRWFEDHGDLEHAVDHALAGAELDRAGDLIWNGLPAWWADGAWDTVDGWLQRTGAREVSAHPALALVGAAADLVAGRPESAVHWREVAQRVAATTGPSAPRFAARTALLHAADGRTCVADMAVAAERAYALDSADSPWRSIARFLSGIAHHLAGERRLARAHLEESRHLSAGVVPAIGVLCATQLGLMALADDDFAEGAALAEDALSRLVQLDLGEHVMSALVHATAAFARSHDGDAERAREEATLARRILGAQAEVPPWYDAEVRIALARAELRLSDAAAARALLEEATRTLRRLPDAPELQAWIDSAWVRADAFAAEAVSGNWALTTAELRVLRFLPSHLSFREIAARLHVSANTIKTQAHAVYRKLDVSSRSEAVAKARAIGLVDV